MIVHKCYKGLQLLRSMYLSRNQFHMFLRVTGFLFHMVPAIHELQRHQLTVLSDQIPNQYLRAHHLRAYCQAICPLEGVNIVVNIVEYCGRDPKDKIRCGFQKRYMYIDATSQIRVRLLEDG